MEPPTMTQTESQIVGMFSNMSSQFNNFTTLPGVQEIKKFGFFLLALNSLSITSCLVLINSILPQNFYEGTRMFASLIFFDVPPW
jgi:archaellum biogenesis protein FlaJ (TadC family)